MARKDLPSDQFDQQYPLQLPLRFRVSRGGTVIKSGVGETLSIGVGHVLFSCEAQLQRGLACELSIDWPVLLDGRTPLQLCVSGEILSCLEERVLVRIVHCEFKLRPARAQGVGA